MRRWWTSVEDYAVFKTVQYKEIQSLKLFALEMFLYGMIFIGTMISIFTQTATRLSIHEPSGSIGFWAGRGGMEDAQRHFFNGSYVPEFCNDRQYWYSDGPGWHMYNYMCVDLDYAEVHEKGEDQMFFLTHFEDTEVEIGDCAFITKESCNGTDWITRSSWVFSELGNECKCSKTQSYFTVGVDEMTFSITHQIWLMRDGEKLFEYDHNKIPTRIRDWDGNLIRTFQYPEDKYITLSITEWLSAAGITLDQINPSLLVSEPAEFICGHLSEEVLSDIGPCQHDNEGAYVRTSGVTINLELFFSGTEKETACDIKIARSDGWHSMGSSLQYVKRPELPTGWNEQERGGVRASKYVDRYRYGVKFRVTLSGELMIFDWLTLQNSLVAGLMYFSMVPILVLFVATMCYNDLESMYKRTGDFQSLEEESKRSEEKAQVKELENYTKGTFANAQHQFHFLSHQSDLKTVRFA